MLTNHFFIEQQTSSMNCRFCDKQFDRAFNLRRHENDYCTLRHTDEQEQEQSGSSGDETDYSKDGMSSGNESMTTTDNESETEQEEDPWLPIITEGKERCQSEFEEIKEHLMSSGWDSGAAIKEANSYILPKLQKVLDDIYVERLMWMHDMKRDPVHRKIMQTKREFIENDDFDQQEALEAAVDKRKFLIKKHLKDYYIFEEHEENDE